jgi:acyl carrier protein
MADIEQTVIDIIRAKAEDHDGTIDRRSVLVELGLDSLDAIEIIFEIETAFSIDVPYSHNDAGPEFETVADVIDAVTTAMAKPSQAV